MPRRRIDPLARQAVLGIAAGRIAIGVGAAFATKPALKALGFAETDAAGTALGRIAGGRDIALGLLALAAHDDRRALRLAALAGAAVDASDAVTFGIAARDPGARRAGLSGVASGSAAAVTGAWAWRRLGGNA
ncbi:MAG TPA: DUF4267 domain-containing protein [Solirubrobacterales bacterium]|nr:DUF4267 domain-containing protein [Solirubrobacterales bacterium]